MSSKLILYKDVIYAQSQTRSHSEAARFLNVAYSTYKKYAKMYNLFNDEHKNQRGRGVSKPRKRAPHFLQEVFDGKHPTYNRYKLKHRLIHAGLIKHSCVYCGLDKTRLNGIGPFRLDYKDGDSNNLKLENLGLICFNCYFLQHGIPYGVHEKDTVEMKLTRADGESASLHHADDLQHSLSNEELAELRKELFKDISK